MRFCFLRGCGVAGLDEVVGYCGLDKAIYCGVICGDVAVVYFDFVIFGYLAKG